MRWIVVLGLLGCRPATGGELEDVDDSRVDKDVYDCHQSLIIPLPDLRHMIYRWPGDISFEEWIAYAAQCGREGEAVSLGELLEASP